MAVVGDFVVGKALEALYAGVEKLIANNLLFKSLSTDIKSKLDSLRPMIHKMVQRNQQSDCPEDPVLRNLRLLMEEGAVLVGNCSEVRTWHIYKKYKYTNKLLKLNEFLEKQLILLNVRVAVVVDQNSGTLHEIQEVVNRLDIVNNQNKSVEIEAGCALPELPSLVVGLDVPLKKLKTELFKDELSMLVLTAPGGCGKTTLATKFCLEQDVKDKFCKNIFFVTVSKKPNLELIMKELYKQKGYEVPTFQNGVFPVKWLRQIEKEKGDDPLLLVLDDVWSGSESLLQKFEFKMSNYKILVTSRSEFPGFGSSYHLQLLDDDNAMQLFHHTASLGDKSTHIPENLSKEIVKRCNGFPLAITVAGRSLCGKPIEMWRSRVIEWSKGYSILDFETELLLRLKTSLDALDNEMPRVKDCFLDLGVFPEDATIEVTTLIDMWAELYDLDLGTLCIAKLYELNNRSLANFSRFRGRIGLVVEEDGDYSDYIVKQHDLLRELAIYYSKQDPMERRERVIIEIFGNNLPKWWGEQKYQPMKARLVSISTDKEFSMKWPHMQLPEAQVLVLNFQTDYNFALPEFVEKMEKLKMLVLNNYSSYNHVDNFQLLESLSNLRRMRLEGINVSFMTKSPVQLKTLRKLYLRNVESRGNVLVKLSHVFPNLKEMVIDFCEVKKLPAQLCDLVHLTKLTIISCYNLSSLPEAIGNLVNLEVLSLRNCFSLTELLESIRNLKKLTFLDIHRCDELKELPEQIGELRSLRKLQMSNCNQLKKLPQSVSDLEQLEEVICEDPKATHLWTPLLPTLKNLRIVVFKGRY